jgi:mannose-6-phosphate isomerase-like protein (cupin superfamily)
MLLVGCSAAPAPEEPPPDRAPVLLVSIPQKAASGADRFKADWSFDLRATEAWSVHVHVIPPGQLVPLHQHPHNEELALVMGGVADWKTVWVDGERREMEGRMTFGVSLHSPAGAAHQVRNRGPETLVTVVVQRPEFGQNWYLLEEEVLSPARSTVLAPGDPIEIFQGWDVRWSAADPEPVQWPSERLGFVVEGNGTLAFEDRRLPLTAGHFFKVPPGLSHRVTGSLRFLDVAVPSQSASALDFPRAAQ